MKTILQGTVLELVTNVLALLKQLSTLEAAVTLYQRLSIRPLCPPNKRSTEALYENLRQVRILSPFFSSVLSIFGNWFIFECEKKSGGADRFGPNTCCFISTIIIVYLTSQSGAIARMVQPVFTRNG
jgi:hypothetical protein